MNGATPDQLTAEQKAQLDKALKSESGIWLTTVRPDGRPHTTPVWFYWDGTHIYFGSQDGARLKMRNIEANLHVTLALPDPYNVVVIEGQAEFVNDLASVGDVLAAYGQKYAEAMKRLGMAENPPGYRLVRITPHKFLVWGMPPGSEIVSSAS